MITVKEYLMNRHNEYPLTVEQAMNMAELLAAVNFLRARYEQTLYVNSGYRPGHYNTEAKGAPKSPHIMCQAIDFADHDGELAKWCLEHPKLLEQLGLYMERPEYTKGWVHLQTRKPASGERYFVPYIKIMAGRMP